ncbi:MAG: hypothetical protein A3D65_02615 [Candidatus Lloydbacteria bacterium RIFCSPHIGHO2_02_FULL_50_13]|uniref:Hemolysin III n=1 Tax=Candidatus Lloydbacteria bacterium RIFCSPHIGHO2_02_FULL_50_13 TaxID=1798661 RepID=A0A1G2D3K2_9BACT|nr:MAG: hypothetical protein A3D65_02615 [Candidatus Lloydbacteria bacterium RIFCSPHIGHO2_02_FULL_50_13]
MTKHDELVSALLHLFGAIFSAAIAVVLIVLAAREGSAWHVVSFTLFGVSLILLYGASSAYHFSASPKARALFRRLDHAMIFVLIAGTYTPLALTVLRGGWGWSLFGVVWGIAIVGMLWKFVASKVEHRFSTFLYVLSGWLVVVAAVPLANALTRTELFWLILGGVFYTAGAMLLPIKRLPVFHTWLTPHNVFHGFVVLGSGSHAWLTLHLLWS